MTEKIKTHNEKSTSQNWYIIVLVICLLVIAFGFVFLETHFKNAHKNSLIWLTTALVLVTGILAWVAWFQLKALHETSHSAHETSRADFLLRIDQQYSSQEVLGSERADRRVCRMCACMI